MQEMSLRGFGVLWGFALFCFGGFFELQVKEHRKKINIIVFYAPIDQ